LKHTVCAGKPAQTDFLSKGKSVELISNHCKRKHKLEIEMYKKSFFSVCAAGALLSVFLASDALARAGTDMSDMSDEIRALIAKERARNMKPTDRDIERMDGSGTVRKNKNGSSNTEFHKNGVKGGCDMNVGNDQPRPGQINAKPKTVIITGPVIQNCK
jgi:hypothetical protein